jgi:chemotaxis signal transduction protein
MTETFVNFSQQDTEILVAQSTLKLLVFPVGNLYFALPVDYVSRVIKQDRIYSSGLGSVGMIRTDDREITIIDLHKKIYLTSLTKETKGYFVLTQNNRGEQFGIHTAITPSIFEVPLSQIRQLPSSYRQADTLGIASHVTLIDQQELSAKNVAQDFSGLRKQQSSSQDAGENSEMATIFLLDVDRLLA